MDDSKLKLSDQICFPIYSVSRLLTKAYKPYLDAMGVTYPQYLVLMVLWEENNLPVKQITEKLLLNTNTVSPLLKRMEKLALIQRQRCPNDERSVIVQLTEKGALLKNKAQCIPENLLKILVTENINLEEVLQLKGLLNQWIEILKENDNH
ncbi:MarR family winged helix-turn-helix transcriptional regulator [Portibacter lacus]|nr:MarR family transcriptional regulator [Portibacter lacus]